MIGWIPRKPPAPQPSICTICTRCSGTGIWRWPHTTAVPGCVQRAVERTGYADFWELTRLNALPKETANYVPVILAVTIMAKNPKDYDLENLETDRPVEYETIDLDTPTSLALIADAADRPVSEIQDLNPALLKSAAPAGYQLRVPKGTLAPVMAALDLVPAIHRADWRIHRVVPGETLAEIARRYATPVSALTSANQRAAPEGSRRRRGSSVAGDLLVVPVASHVMPCRVACDFAGHNRLGFERSGKVSASSSGRAPDARQ